MKKNEDLVLSYAAVSEGGYINHPKDPGGATNRGVTQRTYDSWNLLNGLPKKDVRFITKDESEDIFVNQYFAPVWFDELPSGIDYSMSDFSINSGPKRAVLTAQRVLGFAKKDQDGVMGMTTLTAIKAADPVDFLRRYNQARYDFVRSLKTFKTFGKGWTTRIMGNKMGDQENDIGVIDRSIMMHVKDNSNIQRATAMTIPAPVVEATAKAREEDVKTTSVMAKVFEDPLTLLTTGGAALAPFAGGFGAVEIAVGVVLVLAVGYMLFKNAKKSEAV